MERRAELKQRSQEHLFKQIAAASSGKKEEKGKKGRKERSSALCPKEWSPCVILSLFQHWSKALAKCEALLWWKGTVLISGLTCSIIELWGRWGERGVSTHLWSCCCDILLSFRVLSATLLLLLVVVYTYSKAIWRTRYSELSKSCNHISLLRICLFCFFCSRCYTIKRQIILLN